MTNAVKKKKVAIIGPVPPPVGGVGTHMMRLAYLLKSHYDVELIDESRTRKPGVLNVRKLNVFDYLKTIASCHIIHIHSGPRPLKYAHILVSKLMGKKTILTIHSLKKGDSKLMRRLDGWMYSLPDLTIMVTSDFTDRIKLTNKTLVKEAFLPPILESEPSIPESMTAWVEAKRKSGYQVAVANAWRLDTYMGEDLYGLDLCIAAAQKFERKGKKICFVYVVSGLGGHLDISNYEKQIAELGLNEVFYLHKSQISFVNLIKVSDIVLRPTNTDADALTVREALYLGKSVIASDVVKRPEGTTLFKTRNADSLADTIEERLAIEGQNGSLKGKSETDYEKYYKEIYSNLN